jgi:hypothetical protein
MRADRTELPVHCIRLPRAGVPIRKHAHILAGEHGRDERLEALEYCQLLVCGCEYPVE